MRSFIFLGAAALLTQSVFGAPLLRRDDNSTVTASSDGSAPTGRHHGHGRYGQSRQLIKETSIALTVQSLSPDNFTALETMVFQEPTNAQVRYIQQVGSDLLGTNSTSDFAGNFTSGFSGNATISSDVVSAIQDLPDDLQRTIIGFAVSAGRPSADQLGFLSPNNGEDDDDEAESDDGDDASDDAQFDDGASDDDDQSDGGEDDTADSDAGDDESEDADSDDGSDAGDDDSDAGDDGDDADSGAGDDDDQDSADDESDNGDDDGTDSDVDDGTDSGDDDDDDNSGSTLQS